MANIFKTIDSVSLIKTLRDFALALRQFFATKSEINALESELTDLDNRKIEASDIPTSLPANGGNADTATKLQTARTLWGQSFDGSANVGGSVSGGYFHIEDRSSNPYLQFVDSAGQKGFLQLMPSNGGVAIGSTSSKSLIVTPSGSVGTGTTNPATKLTVDGNISFASTGIIGASYSASDTNMYNHITINASDGGIQYYSGSWTGGQHVAHNFLTGTSNYSALAIMNNGNVGIGTTSPSYKLHVAGDIYTTPGFCKKDSSNDYVLLGGGGHKKESELSVNYAASAGSVAWDNVDNKPTNYVTTDTAQTITGEKTFATNILTISNPNGGDATLKFYRGGNTAWSIVDTAGNLKFNDLNSNTTRLTLLESSQGGYATFAGNINSTGFVKDGSSDNYVLLGGGGHKEESSLSVNYAASAGNATSAGNADYATSAGNASTLGGRPVSDFILKSDHAGDMYETNDEGTDSCKVMLSWQYNPNSIGTFVGIIEVPVPSVKAMEMYADCIKQTNPLTLLVGDKISYTWEELHWLLRCSNTENIVYTTKYATPDASFPSMEDENPDSPPTIIEISVSYSKTQDLRYVQVTVENMYGRAYYIQKQ